MNDLVQRVANRVRLTVGRALLQLVDDARQIQAVQVQLRAGEVRDNVERFQNYGYTSHPFPGAEGIGLAVGGSTDHVVVTNIDDRRHRPTGLEPGEVCIYTDEDERAGKHRIHFKRGKVIEMVSDENTIVMTPDGITLTTGATSIALTPGGLTISAPDIAIVKT